MPLIFKTKKMTKDQELLKEIEEERLRDLEIERENLLSFAIAITIIGLGISLITLLELLVW